MKIIWRDQQHMLLITSKTTKNCLPIRFFWQSTQVTGLYISITVVVRFILGFAIALLLNEKLHLRGLARALIIIPWAVPDIVACLVWIQMFESPIWNCKLCIDESTYY